MPKLSSLTVDNLRKIAEDYLTPKGWTLLDHAARVGGSAAVFQAKSDKSIKALKIYSPDFFVGVDAASEHRRVELQKRAIGLNCESLITIDSIEIFQKTCISIMDYVPWDDLKDHLPSIPLELIQPITDQLVAAVEALATVGLIHRDIKPENILISADYRKIKLVDLGVIRDISTNEDGTDTTDQGAQRPFLATAQYSPPEYLFRTMEPSDNLWNALNLYQIGAVIHDLITQKPIFSDEMLTDNRYRVALAVLTKRPLFTVEARARSPRLASLAERCLVKDPLLRIALVKLDDFRESLSPNPIATFKQELKKHNQVGDSELRSRQVLQENHQKVKALLDKVANDVFDNLNASFGSTLTLSRVTAEQTDYERILEIGIPDSQCSCRVTLFSNTYAQEVPPEIPIFLKSQRLPNPSPLGSATLHTAHDSATIVDKCAEEISTLGLALLKELQKP